MLKVRWRLSEDRSCKTSKRTEPTERRFMEGLIWQNPNSRKMGSYQTPMISGWPARESARPRGLRGAGWNVRPSLLSTLNIRLTGYWT